jgi:signal transduction histidine kinase/integral membrane sensor domain MASE1/ActR/RegA family two-component response regulator
VAEPIWPRWAIVATGTVAVAVIYFLAARLGLLLLEQSDGVAVFWPAAGVASGVLIAVGPVAKWPVLTGVMAATIVANLLGDRNFPSSVFFAVANAGEALLVAGLIERFHGSPFELNSLRRVLGLFGATVVGTAVSGVAGTLGFVLFHSSAASVPTIWLHWFASDALGTITVAPLAIAVASLMRDFSSRSEAIEGILALAVLLVLCVLSIFLPNQRWTLELAVALVCPLFVWIAARFRPALTALATFICAITIVWTTTFAIGIFGDPRLSLDERILSAQATILAISFGALVLAALFSERRLHEMAIVEREGRLQEALRVGGVFSFNWDLPANEVRHSENATLILGPGSRAVFSSAEWLAQIHPDDRPRVTTLASEVHPDASSHAVVFRYLRPTGDEVWLEQIGVTEFDTSGRPKRVHGLTTDITERIRFEREISSARKSAELADRAKSSFLAAASHDLRQPLQTLRFLQGALERHHADGEGRELVNGVGRSLDTMSSILSSLLDVNRIETGNLCPVKTECAVSDIFDSVAIDFCSPIEEKGLRCNLVRSGLLVESDPRMLEEMIRNLLSNAIRYTDRGKILLGCRRVGDKVRIEVWDSGVGITADQLPHIFEEYYQGPGAERGGFGLGLAIVKRLADALGHRVDVRSAPGKGTAFSIEVPRAQTSVREPPPARTADYKSDAFQGTILVVEDETSVRTAVKRLLKTLGIRSVVAGTTNDALAQIKQENVRPEFLLCDYNLRGSANGLKSVETLRAALGWDVPAIVMTGDTRTDTIEEIASHNVSVLIKPFAANELLQLIDELHGNPSSRNVE